MSGAIYVGMTCKGSFESLGVRSYVVSDMLDLGQLGVDKLEERNIFNSKSTKSKKQWDGSDSTIDNYA